MRNATSIILLNTVWAFSCTFGQVYYTVNSCTETKHQWHLPFKPRPARLKLLPHPSAVTLLRRNSLGCASPTRSRLADLSEDRDSKTAGHRGRGHGSSANPESTMKGLLRAPSGQLKCEACDGWQGRSDTWHRSHKKGKLWSKPDKMWLLGTAEAFIYKHMLITKCARHYSTN